MRNKTFILFTLILTGILLSVSCHKDKNCDKTGDFTVLTYNVAGLPEGISSSHPAVNSTPIGILLNSYNIVHVQEDFCYHDSILLNERHPYRTTTLGCVPGGDGLNTFSDYPIYNVVRIKWDTCNGWDCFTPKGFSYSQIEISTGDTVDFYNVHTNAGSTAADLVARRNNIGQLCKYINLHSAGKAAIIMGDMNSRYTRNGDTLSGILGLGFQDVWVKLIRSGNTPQPGGALTECDSVLTSPTCEVVDKIFYRSNGKIELVPVAYQLDDSRFYYHNIDTLPLSDHHPLFSRFTYRIRK